MSYATAEKRNRAARERGWNRREGRRAEVKRAADAALRHPCASPECAALVSREALHCRPCADVLRRVRRERIQQMWLAGWSLRWIADEMGTTVNSIGTTITYMRRDGWNMPHRHRGYAPSPEVSR